MAIRKRLNVLTVKTQAELITPFHIPDSEERYPWHEMNTATPLPNSQDAAVAAVMPPRALLIKPPIPWTRVSPALQLGINGSFFGLSDTVHPMDVVHVAVIGASGSGKTHSAVIPFVNAAVSYQLSDEKKAAVFVLDPKKELLQEIRTTLRQRGETDRLTIIGECPAIQLFTASCNLSATDRFRLLREFSPVAEEADSRSYWRQQADAMLTDLINLEMLYFEKTGERFLYKLAKVLGLAHIENQGFWLLIKSVLAYSCKSHLNLQKTDETLNTLFDVQKISSQSSQFLAPFAGSRDLIEQWSYTVMTAQPMLSAFSDRSIEAFVDMDVIGEEIKIRTQIEDLIAKSKVIVFSPERTVAHTAAGKAFKQRFYETVFSRQDLEKPVFIVLDEYQTFISPSDTDLIDRCRAYRCIVLVCSQSISSLKHALGNTRSAQTVVDILCANTPTRFTFRSNDAETTAWLRTQLPFSPDGGPHVLDVRRLSNLAPGEAYFMFADGTWGRDRASLVH